MFIIYFMAAAAIISTPALAAASYSGTSIDTRSIEQRLVEGAWTGKFLQEDWTFKFRNEDGRLQGRFMTSGGSSWQDLNEILVYNRSVSFSIKSKPKVSFSLEIGAADQNMSGTVTLDGMGTVPFSATWAP